MKPKAPKTEKDAERLYWDCMTLLAFAREIERTVRKHSTDPGKAQRLIRPAAIHLQATVRKAKRRLDALEQLGRSRNGLGGAAFNALRRRLSRLPKKTRDRIGKDMAAARQRQGLTSHRHSLTAKLEKHTDAISESLNKALKALESCDAKEALRSMGRARCFAIRACHLSIDLGMALARYKQEATRVVTRAILAQARRRAR